MSLFNDYSYPLGLDISDLSLKLVQLKKSGAKIKIQALGEADLPAGLLVNGEIKNMKELAKAIRKLIRHPAHGQVSTAEAVICLPESKTFLKIIEIDKEVLDKKWAVENELQKHVPLPLGELYCDWQIIGDSGRSNLVLAGAAPKSVVDAQLDLLRAARLTPAAVETEPIAVCRCLLKEEDPKNRKTKGKNFALVDISATDASLTAYAGNTILFSVSLPVSGEETTAQIADAMGVDCERAEKIKILFSLSEHEQPPEVKKIMTNLTGDLAAKIKEAVGFFNHHFPAWGPIEKILLCGGGASIINLDKIIGEKTGIDTARGNIITNLRGLNESALDRFRQVFSLSTDFINAEKKNRIKSKPSKTVKIFNDASLAYATAVGLALRGIFIDD